LHPPTHPPTPPQAYRVPGGPGIRMDGAVTTGNVVSRYYDSLLAKVIAHAPTFNKAVQKQSRALAEFQVGFPTPTSATILGC
jgi:pyruvate carboxylase